MISRNDFVLGEAFDSVEVPGTQVMHAVLFSSCGLEFVYDPADGSAAAITVDINTGCPGAAVRLEADSIEGCVDAYIEAVNGDPLVEPLYEILRSVADPTGSFTEAVRSEHAAAKAALAK